jgi:zinc transporter ZupT
MILACAIPVGAIFGIYLGQLDKVFTSKCLAVAVGTFLYVGIKHILAEQFDDHKDEHDLE